MGRTSTFLTVFFYWFLAYFRICSSADGSISAGIFKQSMGARNQVGIGSLESILGLLKSLKIRAQKCEQVDTWREQLKRPTVFLLIILFGSGTPPPSQPEGYIEMSSMLADL